MTCDRQARLTTVQRLHRLQGTVPATVQSTMQTNDGAKQNGWVKSGGMQNAARVFLCLTVLMSADPVLAQLSGSVSLVSDYRYRGVSLSDGNPEPQFNLDYDATSGWYAGAMVSGVDLYGLRSEQLIGFAGYSATITPGLSWDAGVTRNTFRQFTDYNYNEAYVGLTSERWSARLFYSPSYFYQDSPSLYAELNGSYPLHDNLNLVLHGGVLYLTANGDNPFSPSSRFDYRLGLNLAMQNWSGQLAWVGLQKKATEYPQYDDLHPRALVASVRYAF
jgi:uncharacterized protein (TIGR02001 family)